MGRSNSKEFPFESIPNREMNAYLNRGNRADDALIVRDFPVLDRDIEIDAHQHALAFEIHLID